jgi:hypothetical protein
VPARAAFFESVQTSARAATPEALERVPRWLILPAPGTRTRERMEVVPAVEAAIVKRFEAALVNLAVTAFAASMVTVQVEAPEQAPLHPANCEPGAGVAVRVTAVPSSNSAEQVAPQSIPGPLTAPLPLPPLETVSANFGVIRTRLEAAGVEGPAALVAVTRERRYFPPSALPVV